jgi:hypothetical protein
MSELILILNLYYINEHVLSPVENNLPKEAILLSINYARSEDDSFWELLLHSKFSIVFAFQKLRTSL